MIQNLIATLEAIKSKIVNHKEYLANELTMIGRPCSGTDGFKSLITQVIELRHSLANTRRNLIEIAIEVNCGEQGGAE